MGRRSIRGFWRSGWRKREGRKMRMTKRLSTCTMARRFGKSYAMWRMWLGLGGKIRLRFVLTPEFFLSFCQILSIALLFWPCHPSLLTSSFTQSSPFYFPTLSFL